MKKSTFIMLLVCSLLTSCSKSQIYEYNKKILDTYSTNINYAIVTSDGYLSKNKKLTSARLLTEK